MVRPDFWNICMQKERQRKDLIGRETRDKSVLKNTWWRLEGSTPS